MNFEKFRKQHFEVSKRVWEIILLVHKHDKNKCPELPSFFNYSFGCMLVHAESPKWRTKESWELAFPFEYLEMSDDKVVKCILEDKKALR